MSQHSFISLRLKAWFLKSLPTAIMVMLILLTGSQAQARIEIRNKEALLEEGFLLQNPTTQMVQAEKGELKLGASSEQEMKGGETHRYRVILKVGLYLNVVVEQKGIDVLVKLFGPEGQMITEVDSPNGEQGPEPVAIIAEVAGEYRLEIQSPDKQAGPGRYEVKVNEMREATTQDRTRIVAKRILTEAEQLGAQGTADSLRKATTKYNEALQLWRLVEDRPNEATTLFGLGVIYWKLSEVQNSLEHYNQALPLWRAVGNRQEEARTLHSIGVDYFQMGDSRKALEYYSLALPVLQAVGDRQTEAITRNATGLAYDRLGRLQEAIDSYNQSLAIQRAIGDRRNEATTLSNIGSAHYILGDLQKAVDYFAQALLLKRATGDRRGEAITLNNIGVTYWQLGENQKALEQYNKALAINRATGDRSSEFTTLHNIGTVNKSMGKLPEALDYCNQALVLVRAIGDRRSEGLTLQSIGGIYRLLGEMEKALSFLHQAQLLQSSVGDRREEAITLSQMGLCHSAMGKPEEARNHLEQALSLQRAIGDRSNESMTLQKIALVEKNRSRFDAARTQIEAALTIIESTRSQLTSQQLRTSFFASRQAHYKFYIDLLMRMHRDQPSAGLDAEALQANERARARSLLEMLKESRAGIRQGVEPGLLDRERDLHQQITTKAERLTRLLSSKHTEEQATTAKKEIELLLNDYREVESQIRAKSPRYAALTQPQPLSLKEIQEQVLDQDTLLLEYSLGDECSYLWVVSQDSINSFELPKRSEIEAAASKFGDLVTTYKNRARQSQSKAATTLSRMLLEPARSLLGQKRLLIVGDGILQYLPFAALPEPVANRKITNKYQPLLVKHEVVSLPSASVLAVLRREVEGRKPATKAVAVLADPVFQNDDPRLKQSGNNLERLADNLRPSNRTGDQVMEVERSAWEAGIENLQRLPYSRKEAEAIVAASPNGQNLKAVDFDASRRVAMSETLAEYRIVHFATHGLLNNQHPELSGIVLSLMDEKGQAQNGFLRLHEVYNLKLPADLVVLSACQTALGKEVKGEGLVGLTRGFMYAGAERIVVSLWAVSDEATAEVMKRFYEGMLKRGMRPAAALRAAQLATWKSSYWEAPYYWAGFILQGEWR
jgi:CHAT domain-containing protein/tetratricopeptide (TPR) repeat protein